MMVRRFLSSFSISVVPPLTALIVAILSSFLKCYYLGDFVHPPDGALYDFIVVGSGSAGTIVASRLSEVGAWKILLLEAGTLPALTTYVPAFAYINFMSSINDWGYRIVSQKHSSFAFVNQSFKYPRGKTLGGSSAVNYMVYSRGTARDFDNWADMGNAGWDFGSVLKYFKKIEYFKGEITPDIAPFASKSGPIAVGPPEEKPPLVETAFLHAGLELGYPIVDHHKPSKVGFTRITNNIGGGIRQSSAEGYLKPVLHRPNLDVAIGAFVTKIILDENNKAIGVVYYQDGKKKTAFVKKEVILSAGSINTPKLLMLSGIGPAEELLHHKIAIRVVSEGVGRNLHDHPYAGYALTYNVNKGAASTVRSILPPFTFSEYLKNRTGTLTVPIGLAGMAWLPINTDDPEWPDIQFVVNSASLTLDYGVLLAPTILGWSQEFYDSFYKGAEKGEAFQMAAVLLRPRSRGTVTLRSADPYEAPIIDPNFLADPLDAYQLGQGLKFILNNITNTHAFKTIGARFYTKHLQTCLDFAYASDAYWTCVGRTHASTFYHPVGTCKMGVSTDPMAVVDNYLRVYDVENLRVIDASIMPLITSGNTNAPSMMIGEKGADLVKQYYGIPT